jgi:uncharacterized membrane protein YdfJ with MMPL/SSD domain
MMSVFGSFVLNDDPTVKQFGVGLSVGVALAAMTVLLLAPALLVLAGAACWWMPAWLNRVLPHVDIEGASAGRDRAPSAEAVEASRSVSASRPPSGRPSLRRRHTRSRSSSTAAIRRTRST